MPLIATSLANEMKEFITSVNKLPQKDADAAIDAYCAKLEGSIFKAIRSLTFTIPPGAIIVVGQGTATNPSPIVLNNVVS